MGTDQISLLSSGVWLIPLVVLAVIGGIYLAVRYFQGRIRQSLLAQRNQIKKVIARRRELEIRLHQYSTEDAEPYGSRVASLRAQIQDIDRMRRDLERRQANAQDQMRHLESTRWLATVGAPYDWYLLDKKVGEMNTESAALLAAAEVAGEGAETIERLSWEVANRSREIRELQVQVNKLLDSLHTHNVHGEAMDQALRQEERSRKALSAIPPYFYDASESAVLNQADRETVAQVHRMIEDHRPKLEELKQQVQDWTEKFNQTSEQVNAMLQAVGVLENTLTNTPPMINTNDIQVELSSLRQIADTLQATLSRLELESMPQVAAEAERVKSTALSAEGRLAKSRRRVGELDKNLTELSEGLRTLSPRFAALGTGDRHPVQWEDSRKRLSDLSRQVNALGPGKKSRTPEQIEADLHTALQVVKEYRDLAQHVGKIDAAHTQAIQLLESPELRGGQVLSERASNLVERVAAYDPENWPRADGAAALGAEVHDWSEEYQHLAAGDPKEPIPEREMVAYLEALQALSARTLKLQERVEKISGRLAEIQRSEESARAVADSLQKNLAQARHLMNSNPRLAEIAGAELERLAEGLGQLRHDLEQRQRGTVERKVTAISTFAGRVETAANTWLDQYTKELDGERKALAEQMASLEAIAALDDPAVAEAKRLLAEGQAFDGASYGRKSRLTLEEVLLELKRRANFAQSSLAAGRALEDLAGPLLETYSAANQNRQHAREQIEEIIAWVKNSRGWPPTSLNLDEERAELQRLDAQWEASKGQASRGINVVQRYGDLNTRYYHLAEKARAKAERIAGEQDAIEALEVDLDEMAAQWQAQRQAYAQNPEAAEAIRQLLEEADAVRKSVQRQAREGRKRYSEVRQELDVLAQKLRRSQVQVDDQHVIDIHGRLIAYR